MATVDFGNGGLSAFLSLLLMVGKNREREKRSILTNGEEKARLREQCAIFLLLWMAVRHDGQMAKDRFPQNSVFQRFFFVMYEKAFRLDR